MDGTDAILGICFMAVWCAAMGWGWAGQKQHGAYIGCYVGVLLAIMITLSNMNVEGEMMVVAFFGGLIPLVFTVIGWNMMGSAGCVLGAVVGSLVVGLFVFLINSDDCDCSRRRKRRECNAEYCTIEHAKHHCKVCGNKDSNHLMHRCPKRFSAIMYHGCDKDKADMIYKYGMQVSDQETRWGACVYLASEKNVAIRHAQNKPDGQLVTCKVNLGNCRFCPESERRRSNEDPWFVSMRPAFYDGTEPPYHSGHALHPKWEKVARDGCHEFFVADPRRVQVMSIEPV